MLSVPIAPAPPGRTMPLLVKACEPSASVPKPLTVPVLPEAALVLPKVVALSSSIVPAFVNALATLSEPCPTVRRPDWVKPTLEPNDMEPLPTLVTVPSFTSDPPLLEFTLKLPLPVSNSRRAPPALRSTAPLFRFTEPLVLKMRLLPLVLV